MYTVNKNHSEGNSCIMDFISDTYGINAARELSVECKDGADVASRCTSKNQYHLIYICNQGVKCRSKIYTSISDACFKYWLSKNQLFLYKYNL